MNLGAVPGPPKFNPMNNISPDMGPFVSPMTVHDNVKKAHKDFEEQFAGPYQSAREEGIIRGKAELMGPGAGGKQKGGLELPDTKWFEEHKVDGGIWIDAQGNHHAMFFPRSEPGTKSVTDQMQPLIDKFVGQITSQAGTISPDQIHAAATMMSATTQAGLAPSEAALRGAQAGYYGRPQIIQGISGPQGEKVTAGVSQTGQMTEYLRGVPEEHLTPLFNHLSTIDKASMEEESKATSSGMFFGPALEAELDRIRNSAAMKKQGAVDFARAMGVGRQAGAAQNTSANAPKIVSRIDYEQSMKVKYPHITSQQIKEGWKQLQNDNPGHVYKD
jgi:hypothetical protein